MGFALVGSSKPAAGDQRKVLPGTLVGDPPKVTAVPPQTVEPLPASMGGSTPTETTTASLAAQLLPSVTVRVNVVVADGFAVVLNALGSITEAEGVHSAVPPLLVPFRSTKKPWQSQLSLPASAVGNAFTVTVIASLATQVLPSVRVTVYVVVTVGEAVGFAIEVLLRPVPGLHAKDPVPVAFN